MSLPESDFQSWLRKGLGRAAAYIRSGNPAEYRDTLLHACTHDLRHDAWFDDVRGHYLHQLVQATGDPAFYLDGILAALSSETDEYQPNDVLQMFAVACASAEAGDSAARQTLYDVFERGAFTRAEVWCGYYLIRLDGLDALLFILRFFDRLEADDRLCKFENLVEELEERDGKEAAARSLAEAAIERLDLARFLEMLRAEQDRRAQAQARCEDAPLPGYDQIKRAIMGQEAKACSLVKWGRRATDEQLRSAAEDLLAEEDEERLCDYLCVFRDRHFPCRHERLVELARSGSRRIAARVVPVLTNVDHPNLRAFALELMDSADRCGLGAKLLARWGRPDDYRLLEQMLQQPMDTDSFERLGISVRQFVHANPSEAAEACLTLLYERGPCSFCRVGVVKDLIRIGRLPDWMRQECQHDAESKIREMAGAAANGCSQSTDGATIHDSSCIP